VRRSLCGGTAQREAFEHTKKYLSSPPFLQAPRTGRPFRVYITTQDKVIGAMFTQEDGKEFVVTYVSRILLDAETRYAHIEKLFLMVSYACCKFRHYILSSSRIITSQHNVIKYIVEQQILSGRLGKWAYSLVEYDLSYESLRVVKGHVVADFIVDHNVKMDDDCLVAMCPWMLFFDVSICAGLWNQLCNGVFKWYSA
jgi:hypothetical protein